ncbi:DUF2185 domain-containing protein [uncultured Erythrobacter sp.]|uniref:immunity protein Imm33 domain-containing protein n=1 Tax=uncultured Erythrobacter sp. TaxID=263913 RepID=UPI002623E46D|nr:DUF2185 domain-containing protein [uncultured Erythrobacter sp.]
MWVTIERIEDQVIYGELDSEPYDMPLIQLGMPVSVPLTHVISTTFHKDNPRPQTPANRQFWDRCFVDACVVEGRSHVDYLYREVPDMTQDKDEHPDSGWRFRGTDEAVDADAANDVPPVYIAIGKVLNKDDRWLHLIDEEPGVAFQWDDASQDYIRFERPDLLNASAD